MADWLFAFSESLFRLLSADCTETLFSTADGVQSQFGEQNFFCGVLDCTCLHLRQCTESMLPIDCYREHYTLHCNDTLPICSPARCERYWCRKQWSVWHMRLFLAPTMFLFGSSFCVALQRWALCFEGHELTISVLWANWCWPSVYGWNREFFPADVTNNRR